MANAPKKLRPDWVPERVPFKSFHDNSKFYNSHSWRKVAIAHKLKNPVCVKCSERGIVTAVAVTDHIVRLVDGGAEFDESNLQSLCGSCHSRKSGKEGNGYKETPELRTLQAKQAKEAKQASEVIKKKETFYSAYCKKMGWDGYSLSYLQMREILDQKGYKNPE